MTRPAFLVIATTALAFSWTLRPTLLPAAQSDTLSKEEALEAISAEEYDLAARTEVTVKEAVASFFRQASLRQPQDVSVATEAQIDRPAGKGQKPPVREVDVQVTMEFEHDPPPQVLREARLEIQRALAAEGWHFSGEESAGRDSKMATVTDPNAPVAQVRVYAEVNGAAEAPLAQRVRQYLTLGALTGACLLGLFLCLWIMQRLLRGLPVIPGKGRKSRAPGEAAPVGVAPQAAVAHGVMPGIAVPQASVPPQAAMREALSPGVPVANVAPVSNGASARRLPAGPVVDDRELPPIPTHLGQETRQGPLDPQKLDETTLLLAERNAVKKAFEQLPFDQALKLLASIEPVRRAAILEKLGLHPQVRHQIDLELAATRPDPGIE